MWILVKAKLKADATPDAVTQKRRDWLRQGKDRELAGRCGSAWRYVIEGTTPAEVFWILETEDRDAVKILTGHFQGLWELTTHEVRPEALG